MSKNNRDYSIKLFYFILFYFKGFFESDPIIMRRSLEILEKEGKCILLLGSNQDEHGVKFL